jgi:hypothetical protein
VVVWWGVEKVTFLVYGRLFLVGCGVQGMRVIAYNRSGTGPRYFGMHGWV